MNTSARTPEPERGYRLPRAGQTFGGLWIERELARGGMGAVFVARDPAGTRFALKVMLLGSEDGGHRRERFRREVEVAKRLNHPNVVGIRGAGTERGAEYLVMELLEGAQPLDAYVEQAQLRGEATIRLVIQACDGVQAAHAQGIVHRDLKPSNVLVLGSGHVKVLDFGLARTGDSQRLTATNAVLGTLDYMAPEQVEGRAAEADARTDVFALGVMLYELLSGEHPFPGDTAFETMNAILHHTPKDIRGLAPDAPPGVAGILAVALAKEPSARYPDAGSLAGDLRALLQDGSGVISGARETQQRRRRWGVVVSSAIGVVGLGASAWRLAAEPAVVAEAPSATVEEVLACATVGAAQELGGAVFAAGLEAAAALGRGEVARARELVEGVEQEPLRAVVRAGLEAFGEDPRGALGALDGVLRAGVEWGEVYGWRAVAATRVWDEGEEVERARRDLERAQVGRSWSEAERGAWAIVCASGGEWAAGLEVLEGLEAPRARWVVGLAAAEQALARLEPEAARQALEGAVGSRRRPESVAERAQVLAERALTECPPLEPWPLEESERAVRRSWLRLVVGLDPETLRGSRSFPGLLETATGFSEDFGLGILLAEAAPEDLSVQRSVGLMAGRMRFIGPRARGMPAVLRALEGERDPRVRKDLLHVLCESYAMGYGEPEEGVRWVDVALEEVEGELQRESLWMHRGRIWARAGALERALVDLNRAAEAREAARPCLERGLVLRRLGRLEEALRDALTYATRGPGDTHQRLDVAVVTAWELAWELDRIDVMLPSLRRFNPTRPENTGWWVRRAWLELRAGEVEAAWEALGEGSEPTAEGDPLREEVLAAREAVRREGVGASPRLRGLVEAYERLRGTDRTP